ncbi:MAG: protein-tyrosine phosphatase family protein [Candidatus Xenobia bacterium]
MRHVLFLALLLGLAPAFADAPPPGFNVHEVAHTLHGTFWRGGAPRRDTVQALQKAAAAQHRTVTFIDLRHPANGDDTSGKQGRLSPADEQKLAASLGLHYLSISALDPDLIQRIDRALHQGDVYIHCMYGVNRTGFAVARWSLADHVATSRNGLGVRDWADGAAFQRNRRP